MEDIKKNVLFFGSCYTVYLTLPDDSMKLKYLDAILKYSFFGTIEETDPIILALLESVKPNIDNSKIRYARMIVNGEKGGRPREIDYEQVFELKEKGYTQKEIGRILNASEKQISRILNNKDITGHNTGHKDITGHNLDKDKDIDMDKDNDIDKVIDNDKDIDRDKEKDKDIKKVMSENQMPF